jgi:hypothetical protein
MLTAQQVLFTSPRPLQAELEKLYSMLSSKALTEDTTPLIVKLQVEAVKEEITRYIELIK